jgi:hypothetical protein
MGKPTVSTVLWMVFAWMISVPGMAEEVKKSPAPLVEMRLSPSRIDWHPADSTVGTQRWMLTLAGPDELFFRREFRAGKAPFFSVFDSEGDRLPDGSYTWELKAISKGPADPRRESGSFSIQEGSFVEAPQDASSGAPKPPLVPIIAEDSIETGNLVVQRNACIGDKCSTTDANFSALKLKSVQPNILFDDIALPEGPTSSHDWALFTNYNDVNQFSIVDFSNAQFPFSIAAGAPDNSLFVGGNGNIGLGTSTPASRLDIKANAAGPIATARIQNSSTTGYPGVEYLDNTGNVDLYIGLDNANANTRINSTRNFPIVVLTNSVERMRVTPNGDIGIGTASPSAHLQVSGSAGTNKVTIEETNGTAAARTMLELRNNGGPFLTFFDLSSPRIWTMGSSGIYFAIDETAARLNSAEFLLSNIGNLTIAGTLTQGSSRDLKTNFVSLDPRDVLAKVNALPVSMWRYKLDDLAARHVGPTAEDFHQAFGLGTDDKHISPSDQAGVALVAVQGLTQEVETLRRENADLEKRIATLEALISALKSKE